MDEMIGYIFGSIKVTDASIKNINKTLKAQRGFNMRLTGISLAAGACIWIMSQQIKMQNERIDTLKNEIEELKNEKGE